MDESVADLTDRLRHEGRWEEASKFKHTARTDFRQRGMSRKEAAEAAWEAYSPLPETDVITCSDVQGLTDISEDWPTLPDIGAQTAEFAWVHAQRLRIVRERGRRMIVDLSRASQPAPSFARCRGSSYAFAITRSGLTGRPLDEGAPRRSRDDSS